MLRIRIFLLCAFSLVFCHQFFSQEAKNALLIANSDYTEVKSLTQPVPEGEDLKVALESIGFTVTFVKNANRDQMFDTLREFRKKVNETGGIAFFHYGGHAVQIDGKNYLIPVDAKIDDEDQIRYRCVELDEVMDSMTGDSNVVILDSCRNDPFPNSRHRGGDSRGLAAVTRKPKNSIIVYSAEAGETAQDGVYTPALTKRITEKGASLTNILMKVRYDVFLETNEKQLPGEYGQLLSPIYLAGKPENVSSSESYAFQGFISVSVITPCEVYIDNEYKNNIGEFGSSVFNVPAGRHKVKVVYVDKKEEEKESLVKESDTEKIIFDYLSDETKENCYNKGNDYFYGKNNVIQNYESAVYYYRLAAEAGFAKAQNSLGYCYYNGHGVGKDKNIARDWYLKAANSGDVDGMINVAKYCEEIFAYSLAEGWYYKAKEAGGKGIQDDIDRNKKKWQEYKRDKAWDSFCDFLDSHTNRTGFSIGLVDYSYCRNVKYNFLVGLWPAMGYWGPLPYLFIGTSVNLLNLFLSNSEFIMSGSFIGFLGMNYTVAERLNLYLLCGYGYGKLWNMDSSSQIGRAGIGVDFMDVLWDCTLTVEYSLDFYSDFGFIDRFFVGLGGTFGR